jgi:hypothetical protein
LQVFDRYQLRVLLPIFWDIQFWAKKTAGRLACI